MPSNEAPVSWASLDALDFLGADRTGQGIWAGDNLWVRAGLGAPCCGDCILGHPLGECAGETAHVR